jgi:N-methylhydantoinase A
MNPIRLGIDVGGTFTDLVALIDGEVVTAKVASTPRNQALGVMHSIAASGIAPAAVTALAHGTTVATNALLERRGVRAALVTTEGFRDVLEIGRQNRPSLYDLTQDRPPTLIPRPLRFTVRERMGPEGVIEPLDRSGLEQVVGELRRAGVEAVAVCLLFSFLHPEHEQEVGAAVRAALPDVHVSLSSEVLPEFREYERFSTTAADAYLSPRLSAYLRALAEKVEEAGMFPPLVMQSSGGVTEIDDAARRAASCLLSGPAGGVVGAAFVAEASGYHDFLTFDMGGTSTDVAPVIGGCLQITTESVVAGVPIKCPMVDVHTVSAGGGSIAWVDEGGALRVGPHSAGADPGPAAYGAGGTDPTVTDANLWLGYLADGAELGGEVILKGELSEEALAGVADRIGMSVTDTALGVVAVANAEMVRALRVISVERGLDPRDFALVAFGGAGPLHACALAEELGITRVLVPRASGVLSALGLAISDLQRDYVRPFLGAVEGRSDELTLVFSSMEQRARSDLSGPSFRRRADLRYQGQSFELSVEADDLAALAARFHDAHERRYGYRMEDEPVELVNVRLVASVPGRRPVLREGPPKHLAVEAGHRKVNFDGDWMEVQVLDRRRMGTGSKVDGPTIVEFAEATCVVRPDWRGDIDEVGTLVLERP